MTSSDQSLYNEDPILRKLHERGLDAKEYDRHTKLRGRASVLVPFYRSSSSSSSSDGDGNDKQWSILFTQRPMHLKSHPGEVCFPGGRQEEQDDGDDIQTALRETREEVGIPAHQITPICRMETCESVNGLCVTPIVALLEKEIDPIQLELCENEVEAAFAVPLSYFWNEDNCDSKEELPWRGETFVMRTYFYKDPAHNRTFKIWGLTAHVVYEVAKLCKPDIPEMRGTLYRWMDETSKNPYWAKRYFVGSMTASCFVLHQYDNERKAALKSETATKKNRLILDSDYRVEELDDIDTEQNNNKYAFSISVLDGRVIWKLAAPTKEERGNWLFFLRKNDPHEKENANKKSKSTT